MTWRVRLTVGAEADFAEILEWTRDRFGQAQAIGYGRAIRDTLAQLAAGPEALSTRARPDLGPGVRSLRMSRRGRHVVYFAISEERTIDILRILHSSMEPSRHIASVPKGG